MSTTKKPAKKAPKKTAVKTTTKSKSKAASSSTGERKFTVKTTVDEGLMSIDIRRTNKEKFLKEQREK